jgi:hypothetical protein
LIAGSHIADFTEILCFVFSGLPKKQSYPHLSTIFTR